MLVKELQEILKDTPEDILLNFYKQLGWNGEDLLNPMKVLLNKADWENLCDRIMQSADIDKRITAGFLWMNNGPSASENVPVGKVHLLDKWTERSEDNV